MFHPFSDARPQLDEPSNYVLAEPGEFISQIGLMARFDAMLVAITAEEENALAKIGVSSGFMKRLILIATS